MRRQIDPVKGWDYYTVLNHETETVEIYRYSRKKKQWQCGITPIKFDQLFPPILQRTARLIDPHAYIGMFKWKNITQPDVIWIAGQPSHLLQT